MDEGWIFFHPETPVELLTTKTLDDENGDCCVDFNEETAELNGGGGGGGGGSGGGGGGGKRRDRDDLWYKKIYSLVFESQILLISSLLKLLPFFNTFYLTHFMNIPFFFSQILFFTILFFGLIYIYIYNTR